jgi:O-antigen biosynthesis protein
MDVHKRAINQYQLIGANMSVLISVYTPTNDPTWLKDTYLSLKDQTYGNWEWVVVPNGHRSQEIGYLLGAIAESDNRVRVIQSYNTNTVGAVKYLACNNTRGEILVELDHDDVLVDTCLQEIINNWNDGEYGFLYSDWVGFTDQNTYERFTYQYGWISYEFSYRNKPMLAMSGFAPSARSLCEIFYAPNHVRVWTKEAYNKAGGYDPSMKVGDDHDLMIRTYLSGAKFKQIPKPLYLYRIHDKNTVKLFNPDIQTQQAINRDKYLYGLVFEEARRSKLPVVNVVGQKQSFEIAGLDVKMFDIIDYLNNTMTQAPPGALLPFESNSVHTFRLHDSLQLIPQNRVKWFMEELHRCLVPGGWILSATPSTDGRGAFQDIRHVSWWNENSWPYWTSPDFAKHYYKGSAATAPQYQLVRCYTDYPSQWHRDKQICYVHADLCAFKGQRQAGLNSWFVG